MKKRTFLISKKEEKEKPKSFFENASEICSNHKNMMPIFGRFNFIWKWTFYVIYDKLIFKKYAWGKPLLK